MLKVIATIFLGSMSARLASFALTLAVPLCGAAVADESVIPRAPTSPHRLNASLIPVACSLVSDKDRAIADCTADIATGKPDRTTAYFIRGNAYASKGEIDRALADFSAAIALNPKDVRFYNNRGLMHEAKGDFGRAITDFDQVLRLEPNDLATLVNRGRLYALARDADKSLADYDRALALDPHFAFAYIARASLHAARGELDAARDDVAKFRQLRPSDPDGAKAEAAIQSRLSAPKR